MRTRPLLTLALLAVALLALSACSSARLAVVDSDRVLNQSVRALSYQKQLDEREKGMALELRLLSGQLPAADLEARRNQFLKELQEMKTELEGRLNKEIRETVAAIVRERGFRGAVIVKDPVLFTQPRLTVDITDEVIAKLK